MKSNRVLAMVSAAQLGCGLAGLVPAIRRRRAFDIPAPAGMLAAQAWAVTVLVRRPDACAAQRTLGALGATMTAGYLAERLVRHRLTPAGWDNAESSVVTAGLSLAAAMALMGLPSSQPVLQGRRR